MFGISDKDAILLSDIAEGETEFIPLLSQEDEEIINSEELPETLPILPLRNTVLFPGVVIPITVGRDKSIRLVREYYNKKKSIGVIAQKQSETEDPGFHPAARRDALWQKACAGKSHPLVLPP